MELLDYYRIFKNRGHLNLIHEIFDNFTIDRVVNCDTSRRVYELSYVPSYSIFLRQTTGYLSQDEKVDLTKTFFADIGSGLGRVLYVARAQGYKYALGLEIDESLANEANEWIANSEFPETIATEVTDASQPERLKTSVITNKSFHDSETVVFYAYLPFDHLALNTTLLHFTKSKELSGKNCFLILVCDYSQADIFMKSFRCIKVFPFGKDLTRTTFLFKIA